MLRETTISLTFGSIARPDFCLRIDGKARKKIGWVCVSSMQGLLRGRVQIVVLHFSNIFTPRLPRRSECLICECHLHRYRSGQVKSSRSAVRCSLFRLPIYYQPTYRADFETDVVVVRSLRSSSSHTFLTKGGGCVCWYILRHSGICLLYTSPSPRDRQKSRMPSSA